MDMRTHRNTLLLIRQILDGKTSTVPFIRTVPQKPPCSECTKVAQSFPRTSPEEKGIASDYLARFIRDLKNDETLDMHGIMILCKGAVIAEGSFGAYDQSVWHITHSACKSVTSLAIGMLIDEGKLKLEDRVVRIFEKRADMIALLLHKDLTVRHLLDMSSGIVFNEAGAVTETDWVKCFLESSVRGESGRRFEYNSMNTYMLSAIVSQVSGQGLMSYLKKRLWEPLGIRDVFWETCPAGIEKGGWGMYIRPEDIAKIGQLVLQKGIWNGRRLVSEEWIHEATSFRIATPEPFGSYNYGYQMWVGRHQNVFLFNGMFGQNVLGFPDTGILIVSNAGNNELFQQSNFYKWVEQYFHEAYRPEDSLPENPQEYKELQALLRSFQEPLPVTPSPGHPLFLKDRTVTSLEELCSSIAGRTYVPDDGKGAAVGLLPKLVQVVQNNYTTGLKSLGFSVEDQVLILTVTESDEIHRLPIGFGVPEKTELNFHGEPYKAAVSGAFTTDEDDRLVLKLKISFVEIANARMLKIFFHRDTIMTKWLESPDQKYISDVMAAIGNEVKLGSLLNTILGKADTDFIDYKINSAFAPEVTCKVIG